MQEMTANSWKRRGCSIVWSPDLLAALITDTEAVPLRTALSWQRHGLPESPPSRTLKKRICRAVFLNASAPTKKVTNGDRRDIEGLAAILHRF